MCRASEGIVGGRFVDYLLSIRPGEVEPEKVEEKNVTADGSRCVFDRLLWECFSSWRLGCSLGTLP